ncbi:MAG: hypothetical protein B6229_01625 [Spirochaetaceae bacterium 4572_7]|nr:MAG: hypothetical protein B6229_01625 [Spirochaetaceae bacterium 4572_7]
MKKTNFLLMFIIQNTVLLGSIFMFSRIIGIIAILFLSTIFYVIIYLQWENYRKRIKKLLKELGHKHGASELEDLEGLSASIEESTAATNV